MDDETPAACCPSSGFWVVVFIVATILTSEIITGRLRVSSGNRAEQCVEKPKETSASEGVAPVGFRNDLRFRPSACVLLFHFGFTTIATFAL